MNSKRISNEYLLLHITYQLIAGVVYGFGIFVLLQRGFSSSEAGLCLSLSSLFNIVFGPLLSNFLDNSKKISSFDVLPIVALMICLLFLFNSFLTSKSFLLGAISVVCTGVYTMIEPIINSLNTNFADNGIKIQFSTVRSAGSFAYGVVCATFGILSETYSYAFIVVGAAGFALALFVTALLLRKDFNAIKCNNQTIEQKEDISFIAFFQNNKIFVLMCFFLVLIFTGYTCTDNFMLQVCENIGGSSSDMGTVLAFKALFEFGGMLLFPLLNKKIGLNKLLILACLGFVIKGLVIYLAPIVTFVYVAQIFQAISFAMIFPGMVEYVYQNLSEKETVRGNALFTLTITIGSMLSSYFAGIICDQFSVNMMELVAFLIILLGTSGLSITLFKTNKHEQ